MKKKNQYILILFFIILISVPLYWILRGQPSSQVSIVEGRVLGLPENNYPTLKIAMDYIKQGKPQMAAKLIWDLYTGGSLPKKFDGAATDQFPFRLPLIKFSKAIDRQIIRLSYMFSNDRAIPADMTSDIYFLEDHDALIMPPISINNTSYASIDFRLENYKDLITNYPNINFFVYYIETLPFSNVNPLNGYFAKADRGQTFNYFQKKLPDEIFLGTFQSENLNEYYSLFYRTDHHWNTFGIIKAYNDIYALLSENYLNIPDKLELSKLITFPDIEFLGTFARYTLYPIEGDSFTGFEADFSKCKVFDQGVEGDYDSRDEYLSGNYPTTPYVTIMDFIMAPKKACLNMIVMLIQIGIF